MIYLSYQRFSIIFSSPIWIPNGWNLQVIRKIQKFNLKQGKLEKIFLYYFKNWNCLKLNCEVVEFCDDLHERKIKCSKQNGWLIWIAGHRMKGSVMCAYIYLFWLILWSFIAESLGRWIVTCSVSHVVFLKNSANGPLRRIIKSVRKDSTCAESVMKSPWKPLNETRLSKSSPLTDCSLHALIEFTQFLIVDLHFGGKFLTIQRLSFICHILQSYLFGNAHLHNCLLLRPTFWCVLSRNQNKSAITKSTLPKQTERKFDSTTVWERLLCITTFWTTCQTITVVVPFFIVYSALCRIVQPNNTITV